MQVVALSSRYARTIQTACILRKNRLHEGKHRASVKCVNTEHTATLRKASNGI